MKKTKYFRLCPILFMIGPDCHTVPCSKTQGGSGISRISSRLKKIMRTLRGKFEDRPGVERKHSARKQEGGYTDHILPRPPSVGLLSGKHRPEKGDSSLHSAFLKIFLTTYIDLLCVLFFCVFLSFRRGSEPPAAKSTDFSSIEKAHSSRGSAV